MKKPKDRGRRRRKAAALVDRDTAAPCPLCCRKLIPGPGVNEHHLVPKSHAGSATVTIHRVCHNAIHAAFTEAELARHYHTIERLRDSEPIRRFVAWVKKRPAEFYAPTRTRRG
jgi:hypothetical protein